MRDVNEVKFKTLDTIKAAQDYLSRRQNSVSDPVEMSDLDAWNAELEKAAAEVDGIEIAPLSDEAEVQIVLDQLELSRGHFGKLHETDSYAAVRHVLDNLQNQIAYITGPGGSGHGPPGGGRFGSSGQGHV